MDSVGEREMVLLHGRATLVVIVLRAIWGVLDSEWVEGLEGAEGQARDPERTNPCRRSSMSDNGFSSTLTVRLGFRFGRIGRWISSPGPPGTSNPSVQRPEGPGCASGRGGVGQEWEVGGGGGG